MLTFDANQIRIAVSGKEKTWTVSQFLESRNPLGDMPLETQNGIFEEVAQYAQDYYDELSEKARQHYDFWKNIKRSRIESRTFQYTCHSISQAQSWEVTIQEDGLFYKDLSGVYKSPHESLPQLLSDFWFHGPAWPVPELDTRKWLISFIRNSFLQVGGKAYDNPFPLFTYPKQANPKQWNQGDYHSGSFVMLLSYGVDFGTHNFHDGLTSRGFLSLENCYTRPAAFTQLIDEPIIEEINTYTWQAIHKNRENRANVPIPQPPPIDQAYERSKQLYMDNGGQIHYIYLDGFGDEYRATATEEAQWKKELIEKYQKRLWEETNEHTLEHIIRGLQYHHVTDSETQLVNRAKQASLRERQAIGTVLWNAFKSDYSISILTDFLKDKSLDSYWHGYAWNSISHRKESPSAQDWIMECLQSNDLVLFRKAQEILLVWSWGNAPLAELLASGKLAWENKIDSDQYAQTLAELRQILPLTNPATN